MNLLLRAIWIFALFYAIAGRAQTPVPIPMTGNVSMITGGSAPYAGVSIQLAGCPAPVSVPGYSVIVPTQIQLEADGTGLINSTVWPNDKINCNGTTGASQYSLQYIVNGTPTADPVCYQVISSQPSWNLNVQQPIACGQSPPNPMDATFNNVVVNQNLSVNILNLTGNLFQWNNRLGQSYSNVSSSWLTFTNPVFNQSVVDNTTTAEFSGAQGDGYVTPINRVVSSDDGVNDTAPAYYWHNCNYQLALTSAPCVGMFSISQDNPNDLHSGVWGANILAIQYRAASFSPTYGLELNVFNETNTDPGSPDNPNGSMAPIFGYASTMGGVSGSNGTAAFFATDTNLGSYWWDGLYVQRAKYAALEAGPVAGGSGLQYSVVSNPEGQASSGTNFPSVPQYDLVNDWNGTGSYLEGLTRQFVPRAGNNPINCYTYTFSTNVRHELCDDGELIVHVGQFQNAIRVTPDVDADSSLAFQVTNHANSTNLAYITKMGAAFFAGQIQVQNPVLVGLTRFTVSGCSASSPVGTGTTGTFVLGANSCTAVITMNGVTGMTAPDGWTCDWHDRNAAAAQGGESSSTMTTASFTIPSSATTGDVISFSCTAF